MFSIVNEALVSTIGMDSISSLYVSFLFFSSLSLLSIDRVGWYSYLQAYNMIRGITGVGEGKGPIMTIHDGFQGLSQWAGFLNGADRLALGKFLFLVPSTNGIS